MTDLNARPSSEHIKREFYALFKLYKQGKKECRAVSAIDYFEARTSLLEAIYRAYAAGQKAHADDHGKALEELARYWEFKVKDAKEEAYAAGRADLRIGLLRQWLNEDRISDPHKMVTNEQIESMLGLPAPKADDTTARECEKCSKIVYRVTIGKRKRIINWVSESSQCGESEKYPGELAGYCAEHNTDAPKADE